VKHLTEKVDRQEVILLATPTYFITIFEVVLNIP